MAVAITFPLGGGSVALATSTRSPTITFGGAPQENDIIVVFLSSTTSATIAPPSGWVNVLGGTTDVESDSHQSAMLYHRVTAAEAGANQTSWTLTNVFGATENGRVGFTLLRGVVTSGELVGSNSTFSSVNAATPWVIASVIPTADDCQIIAGVSGDGTESIASAPAGWTVRASGWATQSNAIYSRDALGSNGVATGTTNVTPSAGNEYISIVAAFKPAVGTNINNMVVGMNACIA